MVSSKRKFSPNEGSKTSNKKSKDGADLSSSAQKRLLKQERQSHRRHADVVTEAKVLWNSLREKSNTKAEVRSLTDKISVLIEGKIAEIALQHDASRVVQSLIKFGTKEQRRQVVKELSPRLVEISKTQYAHFCVTGMIKYCYRDEVAIKLICKALRGQMVKLAVHAVAARVVEEFFLTMPAKHTGPLKQEFYGPHVALFASTETAESKRHTLQIYIEKLPEKKDLVCDFLFQQVLQKGIDKALFHFVYFQELLGEYFEVVDGSKIRASCGSLVDHSIQLINSRAGARALALLATYGTAKDRRRIMKSLKGYTLSSLLHEYAYLSMLVLINVTDDTVSIYKSVLAELLTLPQGEEVDPGSSLLEIAMDNNASKLMLLLLTPDPQERKKYLDPLEQDLLWGQVATVDNEPCSRKNPETRRKELLAYLKNPLKEMCEKNVEQLATCISGSRVLKEVYREFRPQSLVNAIIGTLQRTEDSSSFLEDPVGHLTIKHLILADTDHDDPLFAKTFAQKMDLSKVARSNRGAFCLCALHKVPSLQQTTKKAIDTESVEQTVKGSGDEKTKSNAGFRALLTEVAKLD